MNIKTEKQLENKWGPANAVTPIEIINMFRLAELRRNDVFYDLGSGHGRVIIMAIIHGKVKRAIGIEQDADRFCRSRSIAKNLLSKKNLKRIDFLCGWSDEFEISDATVVYESHDPFDDEDKLYKDSFKNKEVRIIKKHLPLIGYLPIRAHRDKKNSWFFLMKSPLQKYRTRSKSKWASLALGKKNATMQEFLNDYNKRLKKYLNTKDRKDTIKEAKKLIRKYLPCD